MKKISESLILPYLALILAMILWGNSFIMIKLSYRAFSPDFVMFARMALASLVFIPFLKKFKKQYREGDWKWLLLMAFFEPVLYFTFESRALLHTTASQAGLITALLPILVAVPSTFILKEKPTLPMYIGFCLAMGGAIWLSINSGGTSQGSHPLRGNLLEFLAMVSAAGYTITSRKLSHSYSPLLLTAVQCLVGGLYFFLRLLFQPPVFPGEFPLIPSLAVAFLGLMVSLGAYTLYNYGIAKTSATSSALFVNLIPLVTLISAMIILKEQISPIQYKASALVLGGVIISQLPKKLGKDLTSMKH